MQDAKQRFHVLILSTHIQKSANAVSSSCSHHGGNLWFPFRSNTHQTRTLHPCSRVVRMRQEKGGGGRSPGGTFPCPCCSGKEVKKDTAGGRLKKTHLRVRAWGHLRPGGQERCQCEMYGDPLQGRGCPGSPGSHPHPELTLKMVLSPSWLGPCRVAWRHGMQKNFLSPLTHCSPGYWQLFT